MYHVVGIVNNICVVIGIIPGGGIVNGGCVVVVVVVVVVVDVVASSGATNGDNVGVMATGLVWSGKNTAGLLVVEVYSGK